MYYLLVRIWTLFAFALAVLLGYLMFNSLDQLAELSLFLGCGTGLIVWMVGVIVLATLLHPKRTPDVFET